jgi:putative metallohydrolase (TIGR04338 family)
MKDMQRQRVYDAEEAAFGASSTELTVEEMQRLIDKWVASKTLQRRYPRANLPLKVTDGRSRRRGGYHRVWYGPDEIRMPRRTRTKWYLLHELAHALSWSQDQPAHGWQFAECYLYLVRVYLGKGAEEKLRQQFKAHKVRSRAPRKRIMTDQQREAARQRMLAMHAARQQAARCRGLDEAA